MFKVSQTNQYQWPVTVKVPADGGRFDDQKFKATFRALAVDRQAEVLREASLPNAADGGDMAMLREVLVDWADVLDADSKAVPLLEGEQFSAAAEGILQLPFVQRALVNAYFDSCNGRKAKN